MSKSLMLTSLMAASLCATPALAEYPERPITYIIAFGAGGGADLGARTWGPFMEKCLGQPIVFINKPGAGGELGFAELANSAPDGYTLGTLNMPNVTLGAITKQNPSYKVESFTYLGNMYGSRVSINAKRGGKYETLEQLVAAAKEAPVNLALSNIGADDFVIMLKFMKAADVKFNFIPLGDAATSRNAVIGGHVDVAGLSMTEVSSFQSELQTLAVAAEERMPSIPNVPTFKEKGFDIVGGSNHLIGGPAGLPQAIVEKIDGCLTQVAADPEFIKVAAERNLLMNRMTAAEASKWVAEETEVLKSLWESDPWIK